MTKRYNGLNRWELIFSDKTLLLHEYEIEEIVNEFEYFVGNLAKEFDDICIDLQDFQLDFDELKDENEDLKYEKDLQLEEINSLQMRIRELEDRFNL